MGRVRAQHQEGMRIEQDLDCGEVRHAAGVLVHHTVYAYLSGYRQNLLADGGARGVSSPHEMQAEAAKELRRGL